MTRTDENNNEGIIDARVWDTRGLSIVFVRVDCFGPLPNYVETAVNGAEFTLGQWPVAPSDFEYRIYETSIACGKNQKQDFSNLKKLGDNLFKGVDHIVGIVDQTWFDQRYPEVPNASGLTKKCGSNLHFVLDGDWTAVAHEIGHTYQLSDVYKTDDPCKYSPSSEPVFGYWVEQQYPIEGLQSLMDASLSGSFPDTRLWITIEDYTRIFDEFLSK